MEALDLICQEHGIPNRNLAIRVLIRAGGGLIEPDPEVVSAWKETGLALAKSGNLINQIARAANRGGIVWDKKDDAELQTLRTLCLQLAKLLADFAAASRRRRVSKPVIDRAIAGFGDG